MLNLFCEFLSTPYSPCFILGILVLTAIKSNNRFGQFAAELNEEPQVFCCWFRVFFQVHFQKLFILLKTVCALRKRPKHTSINFYLIANSLNSGYLVSTVRTGAILSDNSLTWISFASAKNLTAEMFNWCECKKISLTSPSIFSVMVSLPV